MAQRVSRVYLYTESRAYWGEPSGNGELTESLYETLYRALHSDATGGEEPGDKVAAAPASIDFSDGVLAVPRLSDVLESTQSVCCSEGANQTVTVKLFFYGSRSPGRAACQYCPDWVVDALGRIAQITRTPKVDTLILAFPELAQSLDADRHTPDADTVQCIRSIWNTVGGNANVRSLGVSDLGRPALEAVFERVDPAVRGQRNKQRVFGYPKVVASGVRNDACYPLQEQQAWAHQHDGKLVAHKDQMEMLSQPTLNDLAAMLPQTQHESLRLRWVARVRTARCGNTDPPSTRLSFPSGAYSRSMGTSRRLS